MGFNSPVASSLARKSRKESNAMRRRLAECLGCATAPRSSGYLLRRSALEPLHVLQLLKGAFGRLPHQRFLVGQARHEGLDRRSIPYQPERGGRGLTDVGVSVVEQRQK